MGVCISKRENSTFGLHMQKFYLCFGSSKLNAIVSPVRCIGIWQELAGMGIPIRRMSPKRLHSRTSRALRDSYELPN